jgi:chromosome transmission fidelity protein 1
MRLKLDFRHQQRKTAQVCDELGRTLLEICKAVPAGIVVFLPSYSYEAHLVRRWKSTGIWTNLLQVKGALHREPKSSQQVESTLEAYSRDAQGTKGALLLSVVGGKMSEGINFADDMARCVVVVGLPYPDITDPELKEKMTTMDQNAGTNKSKGAITGQVYYHNLCMRAVNQSVGRAIRHANDYASILLVDARYSTDVRVAAGLPQWLRRAGTSPTSLQGQSTFGDVVTHLKAFFEQHKNK